MSSNSLNDHIDHSGIVEEVVASKNLVKVRLDGSCQCGGCPAARICEASGEASNVVTITTPHASSFRKGDIVTVRGTEQMHRKAIMYATVLPCIALIATMVAVFVITFNQLAAALAGVGVTIIFYIILWAARNRIAHEFNFTITGTPERPGNGK